MKSKGAKVMFIRGVRVIPEATGPSWNTNLRVPFIPQIGNYRKLGWTTSDLLQAGIIKK